MKISILAFLLGSIIVVSCSDDNTLRSTTVAPVTYDYSDSKITINKAKYIPTVVSVIEQKTTNIKRKKRTFFLNNAQKQSFAVQFNFATSLEKINGVYSTDTTKVDHAYVTYYEDGRYAFNAIAGDVSIRELGDGKYTIGFVNVEVYNPKYTAAISTDTIPKGSTSTNSALQTVLNSNMTVTDPKLINQAITEFNNQQTIDTTTTPDPIITDPKKRLINGSITAKFDKKK